MRGIVLGSGFAGQGHAEAMRSCGIEVVGMVSRTAEVVEQVAADMGYRTRPRIGLPHSTR